MRILIVDDIKGWRDYHNQIIKNIISDAEIEFAESAKEAYDLIIQNNENPFECIFTDMQMESDFSPKYAGEWLVEQIKTLKNYNRTKTVIISAAYNIELIAKLYSVDYIRKSTARNFPEVYKSILE